MRIDARVLLASIRIRTVPDRTVGGAPSAKDQTAGRRSNRGGNRSEPRDARRDATRREVRPRVVSDRIVHDRVGDYPYAVDLSDGECEPPGTRATLDRRPNENVTPREPNVETPKGARRSRGRCGTIETSGCERARIARVRASLVVRLYKTA